MSDASRSYQGENFGAPQASQHKNLDEPTTATSDAESRADSSQSRFDSKPPKKAFREDRITGAIETQSSKIPSSGYLAAALGSIAASAILKIAGKDEWALFVGQWPAAFL